MAWLSGLLLECGPHDFTDYLGNNIMKTTLNQIREKSPCRSGWVKLLAYLGKTKADDEPLDIATVLDSNGIEDALWCLRAVQGRDKEIRLYAVWCARQVHHLMTDPRSLAALGVAERFAIGEATEADLSAAWVAAEAAIEDGIGNATWEAAWAAAWAAQANRLRELCAECESGVTQ